MKFKKIIRILLILSLLLSVSFMGIKSTKAPFDLSQVVYYDRVKEALSLTPEQELALIKNGFVSVDISDTIEEYYLNSTLRFEDFYFGLVYRRDLPVIITTDSILHLFHVVFDCSLKDLEKQIFYPMLLEITQFAFNSALDDYKSIINDGSIKYWAIRNSTVYFAVGLSLLTNETVELPTELQADVNFFLDNINTNETKFVTAAMWFMPEIPEGVEVKYDFTEFKVRGHYLGDAKLEQYFRTFMWYGQFPVFIPRNDELYVWFVPYFNDACIVYIRDVLKSSLEYYTKWMQLYNVTSVLVGESDSINLLNLEAALKNVFGNANKYLDFLVAEQNLTAFREELSKPEYQQQILSQALIVQIPGVVLPHYPIVFQFMGQRYVPDSYIFQMLCWDKVGFDSNLERRIMPKGFDVFAVLGSERAYQLLIPDFKFENYTNNLKDLRQDFKKLTEENWTQSSYMAWVHALQSLVDIEYSDNYPEFMRTLAWQDEKLNTGLGSWSQLRHDTLLYAKQTYIPAFVCSYPEAFVEPYPTFYSRMQKLSQRTLDAVNILNSYYVKPAITWALETLKNVTQKLEVISTKELAKQPLTSDETEFIKQVAWLCGSGGFVGWYVDTIHEIVKATNSTSTLEVPLIADVATFPPDDIQYPPQILHVGVGYVNALVVLFPLPNGTLVAAVGPIFSYYEFRLIGTKRLNDKEWKEILTFDNRTSYLPQWFKDVYGMGEPSPASEYRNGLVLIAAMALVMIILIPTKVIRAKNSANNKKIS